VSRWYSPSDLDETGRMVSLAIAALLSEGISNPQAHLCLAVAVDRRGILIVGGVAAASIAAYGVASVIGVARRCSEFAAGSEAAAQSAMRIGCAYLCLHPEEASEADLLAAAAGRFLLIRALSASPDTAAVFRIMDEVEIVNCRGWILAKSEARACALFALRAARVA
jgi:hypothetical protein